MREPTGKFCVQREQWSVRLKWWVLPQPPRYRVHVRIRGTLRVNGGMHAVTLLAALVVGAAARPKVTLRPLRTRCVNAFNGTLTLTH